MALTLSALDFLASPLGSRLLERLASQDLSDDQTLPLLTRLRREYSPEQAGAALAMARLRRRAVGKFGADAAGMFFTAEALEQASDPLIRRYRAETANGRRVVDACCGIGSDSLAMAAYAEDVLGLDSDPLRVVMARYNAAALGVTNARFEVADVRDGLPEADLVFFDPARRDASGRRVYDVERYQPPLSAICGWRAGQVVVKLSPGVDLEQLVPYGGTVEFVSVRGDLKEAALRLTVTPGSGPGPVGGRVMATLLVDSAVYHWRHDEAPVSAPMSAPRGWLVEPDPALLRAGLVQAAAVRFGGCMLDATIAYFTVDTKPESPWVRAWQVLDWMPFNLKRLRAYLRERGVGRVTVKKRGSPLTPEGLIPQLKLRGSESRTLALTRCAGQPIVVICGDR